MSDFSQSSTRTTTFHILRQDLTRLRSELKLHSRWKKTVLVIPLLASDALTSPYRITERFLRLAHSHPEFKPFLDAGLADAILAVERKTEQSVFEMPQTVSWERMSNKLPKIFHDLIEVVEQEKRRFA